MNNPKYKIVSSIFISNKNTFSGLNQSGGMPPKKSSKVDDHKTIENLLDNISVRLIDTEEHRYENTRDVLDYVTRLISINNKRLQTTIITRILTDVKVENEYLFSDALLRPDLLIDGRLFKIIIKENQHGVYINVAVSQQQLIEKGHFDARNQVLHFTSHKKKKPDGTEFNTPVEDPAAETDTDTVKPETAEQESERIKLEQHTRNIQHFKGVLLGIHDNSIYNCTINVRNKDGFPFFYPKIFSTSAEKPSSLIENIIVEEINNIYYNINLAISKYFVNDPTIQNKISRIQNYLLENIGIKDQLFLPKDYNDNSKMFFFNEKYGLFPNIIDSNKQIPRNINIGNCFQNYSGDNLKNLLKKIGADFITNTIKLRSYPLYFINIIENYNIIPELNIQYQVWLIINNQLQAEITHGNADSSQLLTTINHSGNLLDYTSTDEYKILNSLKKEYEKLKQQTDEAESAEVLLEEQGKASQAKLTQALEQQQSKLMANREAHLSEETLRAFYTSYLLTRQKKKYKNKKIADEFILEYNLIEGHQNRVDFIDGLIVTINSNSDKELAYDVENNRIILSSDNNKKNKRKSKINKNRLMVN